MWIGVACSVKASFAPVIVTVLTVRGLTEGAVSVRYITTQRLWTRRGGPGARRSCRNRRRSGTRARCAWRWASALAFLLSSAPSYPACMPACFWRASASSMRW